MRSVIAALALFSALNAGVYDYGYNGTGDVSAAEKNNPLYYGDFERIIRYDAIAYTPCDPVKIDQSSGLDKMYQSIDGYTKASVPYKVSVIGHTRRDQEADHETVQESTFFGSLQNALTESLSDAQENRAACERAVEAIKKELMNRNVQESDIVTECRDGSQPLYLENDGDARERNYRVMVTLYMPKAEKKGQPAPVPAPAVKPEPVAAPAPTAVTESDSDGDGVADGADKCPNTPKGYKVDENGCPREVTLHINFATASAVIPSSASKEIEDLKRFMSDYPMYNIDIIGHTDSIGRETDNQVLSVKRAKALENILIQKGIARERITSTGMGERAPIASNIEESGRAKNRRTEVKMYVNPGK